MQAFNVVSMYNPRDARFNGFFECRRENRMLTVRDVIQENRIRLTSDLFNSTVVEDRDETIPIVDLCRRDVLFFVRNMQTGEVVLFGRRENGGGGDSSCD